MLESLYEGSYHSTLSGPDFCSKPPYGIFKKGRLAESLYNKDHSVLESILGPAIFGNPHMVFVNWLYLFMGVPTIRVLLFGVYIRAPDLWKLPDISGKHHVSFSEESIIILTLGEMLQGLGLESSHSCRSVCPNGVAYHV